MGFVHEDEFGRVPRCRVGRVVVFRVGRAAVDGGDGERFAGAGAGDGPTVRLADRGDVDAGDLVAEDHGHRAGAAVSGRCGGNGLRVLVAVLGAAERDLEQVREEPDAFRAQVGAVGGIGGEERGRVAAGEGVVLAGDQAGEFVPAEVAGVVRERGGAGADVGGAAAALGGVVDDGTGRVGA